MMEEAESELTEALLSTAVNVATRERKKNETAALLRTPLHFAAENGHDKIVEQLLAHSGLVNAPDKTDRKTALYLAIERGHDLVVAQLMRYKPSFELEALVVVRDAKKKTTRKQREKKSAVYLAVEKGHEKIVALLLANPESATLGEDKTHRTPLHIAAANGLDPIVALLLAREPSVADVRDCHGETALHHAVRAGHTNIVAQLLAHSPATVHAVNKKQESVLHFAAQRGSVEITELLLTANAAIDAIDREKSSALHRAVDKGHTELVELLLARKALVTDERDDDDDDPLLFGPVCLCYNQIVAMLLAHSPQLLDARSKYDGRNALHYADDPEIVQQLLSLNPTLLVESDWNGSSPFLTAVRDDLDKALAQMLTQCPGADVFGEGGAEALAKVAFRMSNEQTLEVLLAHKPELIHVKLSGGMLLHYVLDRRDDDERLMSRAFVTKVWELDKQAVHVVNDKNETPFHIALRTRRNWAIEMMQRQLSFDEIIEQLPADVTEVVCEYLSFESRKGVVGKRARE